jgi:hypothetical protein
MAEELPCCGFFTSLKVLTLAEGHALCICLDMMCSPAEWHDSQVYTCVMSGLLVAGAC